MYQFHQLSAPTSYYFSRNRMMMMITIIIIILMIFQLTILVPFTTATIATTSVVSSSTSFQSVNFTDCGKGNVKDVRINPCIGNNPCIIQLGTNVTVEADFIAPFDVNKLYENIKGVIREREIPFPEQRIDPCNSGNILPSCPLKKDEIYQFKAWFEVKPFYPTISLKVRYSLTDPTGQKIVCVQVATKIIDPNPKSTTSNHHRGRNRSKSINNKSNLNKQKRNNNKST